MLEGVFPIGDIYFFSSSVQRFWLLRYLTNYDCNKGHKGLICWPLVPAEIIWDMLTTVYLNTRLTSWLMWPNRTRKTWTEKIPPNLAMPLGLRFDKFITGYETIRPLLLLGPNVITDRTFITLGFKILLRMGLSLCLGPNVITDGNFITLGSSYYTCAFWLIHGGLIFGILRYATFECFMEWSTEWWLSES